MRRRLTPAFLVVLPVVLLPSCERLYGTHKVVTHQPTKTLVWSSLEHKSAQLVFINTIFSLLSLLLNLFSFGVMGYIGYSAFQSMQKQFQELQTKLSSATNQMCQQK